MSRQQATIAVAIIFALLLIYRTNSTVASISGVIVSVCFWYGAWEFLDWVFDEWGVDSRPGVTFPASIAAGAAVLWMFTNPGTPALGGLTVHF